MIKQKSILAIHCNFQTCFSCQKAAGGFEIRSHTAHGDSSISTVSYIRGFFNSIWNTYRLCLKCQSWESFPVLLWMQPTTRMVVPLTASPGMQHPTMHSGSCWKKIQAMEVERDMVHVETWRRECRAHCRSLLPHSSKPALQPQPWGWCRLTANDWGLPSLAFFGVTQALWWERGWAMVQHCESSCSVSHRAANRKAKHHCLLLSVPTLSLFMWQNLEDSSKIREVTGLLGPSVAW